MITGLTPDANYLLSGWVRTEGVAPWAPAVVGGANLSLSGTWLSTPALTGTNDWTYVSMAFNAGPTGGVTVAARVGFWGAPASGTARGAEIGSGQEHLERRDPCANVARRRKRWRYALCCAEC